MFVPSQKHCQKEVPADKMDQKFDEVLAGVRAGNQADDVMEAMIKLARTEDFVEGLYDAMEPSSPLPALPSSRVKAKRCAPERSLSCLRSEPVYAARPARFTLPRGETAADWRGTFRELRRKSKDSSLAALRSELESEVGDKEASRIVTRLNELEERQLQENFANWLEACEECGTVTLQDDVNTTRDVIFTALGVSPFIRVRSSLLSGRVLCSFPSQKLCEKEGAADEIVAGFLAGRQANDVMEALGKLSRHSAENWSEEIYERTSAEPSSPLPALPSSRCKAKRAALERSLSCP